MNWIRKSPRFLRLTGFCLALLLALGNAPAMSGYGDPDPSHHPGMGQPHSGHDISSENTSHENCNHCSDHKEQCKDGLICASMCPSAFATGVQVTWQEPGIQQFFSQFKADFQTAFLTRLQKVPVQPPRA